MLDEELDFQGGLQNITYQRRPRYQRTRREISDENDFQEPQQRYYNRGHGQSKLRMDISIFNGALHIEDFLEWVTEVERFFDYMDIDEDQQVKLVVLRFKRITSAWWDQTVHNRRKFNQRPVQS